MNLFDKAKDLSDRVSHSITEFSSDEIIANTITKAVEKQEKVNALLREKGSNYRISDIEIEMGMPPTVSFAVRRLAEIDAKALYKTEEEVAQTGNVELDL